MKNAKNSTASKTASKNVKSTRVHVVRTNYHYWRHWVKTIVAGTSAKFVKDSDSYDGAITVEAHELIKVNKILSDYKKKNTDTVDMWS